MEPQILPRKRVEQILSRAWVWETLAQHTDILAHDAALRAEIAWQSKHIDELEAKLKWAADTLDECLEARISLAAQVKKLETDLTDQALGCAELKTARKRIEELEVANKRLVNSLTNCTVDRGRAEDNSRAWFVRAEAAEAELATANDWLERITGPIDKGDDTAVCRAAAIEAICVGGSFPPDNLWLYGCDCGVFMQVQCTHESIPTAEERLREILREFSQSHITGEYVFDDLVQRMMAWRAE